MRALGPALRRGRELAQASPEAIPGDLLQTASAIREQVKAARKKAAVTRRLRKATQPSLAALQPAAPAHSSVPASPLTADGPEDRPRKRLRRLSDLA